MARNWGSGHAGNAIHQGHLVRSAPKIDPLVNLAWKPPHMSANSCFNMFQHVSTCLWPCFKPSKKTGHVVQWTSMKPCSQSLASSWFLHARSWEGDWEIPISQKPMAEIPIKGLNLYICTAYGLYIYNIMVIYIYIYTYNHQFFFPYRTIVALCQLSWFSF